MKVLLDTNILIHREAQKIINPQIGRLFYWLDSLGHQKIIHPLTLDELRKHLDTNVVSTMLVKAESYHVLKSEPAIADVVRDISKRYDKNENDVLDTKLLNQVYSHRVDCLITEDAKIHTKASELGIQGSVFRIDEIIQKFELENPEFIDYKVLSIKKVPIGSLDINSPFFESLQEDYRHFETWFNRKSEEDCYASFNQGKLVGFLYLKLETESEVYRDIAPAFSPKRRLKIGTFKAIRYGYNIGERFLKIIFDNALKQKVEEIYVTVFPNRPDQLQLIFLLGQWGFLLHGEKVTTDGTEQVYVRDFNSERLRDSEQPKFQFPFIKLKGRFFVVSIKPEYHRELFPDSLLKTENPLDYIEDSPSRNSICKVYISHAENRDIRPGDTILIYRIGESLPKKYSSTITTLCIADGLVDDITSEKEFLKLCRGKTLFSEEELVEKYWNRWPANRPFIINLLFARSLPVPKPTLNDLLDLGIIKDIMNIPRGIFEVSFQDYDRLIKFVMSRGKSK